MGIVKKKIMKKSLTINKNDQEIRDLHCISMDFHCISLFCMVFHLTCDVGNRAVAPSGESFGGGRGTY